MKSYKRIMIDGENKRLHRHIMECYLGRSLKSSELVHHINENIWDNRLENLEVVSRSMHKRIHSEIGRKTRFKKQFDLNKEELFELSKKYTYDEMANMFKCSRSAIQRVLKYKAKKKKVNCIICGRIAIYIKDRLCKNHYYNKYYREKLNGKNEKSN